MDDNDDRQLLNELMAKCREHPDVARDMGWLQFTIDAEGKWRKTARALLDEMERILSEKPD